MYIHISLSPLYMYVLISTFNGKNWVIRIWKISKNHLPQTAARPAATPSTGVKFPSGLWSGNLPSRYAHTPRDPQVIGSFPPKKKLGRSCRVIFFWSFLKRQKKTDPKVGGNGHASHGMFRVFHHFRACPSCICANMPDSCRDPKEKSPSNAKHPSPSGLPHPPLPRRVVSCPKNHAGYV